MTSAFRIRLCCVGLAFATLVGCGGKESTKNPSSGTSSGSDADSKVESQTEASFKLTMETTFVVSPLRSDGRVDYLESLEKDVSIVAGTPNAAVDYWYAVGAPGSDGIDLSSVFEKLGVKAPAMAEGLKDFESFLDATLPNDVEQAERDAAELQLTLGMARPWRSDDLPILNAWLEASQPSLDRVQSAVAKQEFFNPFVPIHDDELVISRRQPSIRQLLDLNRVILANTLKVAGYSNIETAWQNLDVAYAMTRHIASGNTYADYYLASQMQQEALQCEAVLAQFGNLSKRQWESRRDKLNELLTIWTTCPGHMHRFERCSALDMILFAALYSQRSDEAIDGAATQSFVLESLEFLAHSNELEVDWNTALSEFNTLFDRFASISNLSIDEQLKSLDALSKEVTAKLKESGVKDLQNALINNPIRPAFESLEPMPRGQLVAQVMFRNSIERRKTLVRLQKQTQRRLQSVQIALSLSAYATAESVYPDQLESLAPDYQAASNLVPYAYRRLGAGYAIETKDNSLPSFVLADRREIDRAAERMRRLVPRMGVNPQFGGFVEKLDLSGMEKPSSALSDLVAISLAPEVYLRQLPPSKDARLFLGLRTIQTLDLSRSGATGKALEQIQMLPRVRRIRLSDCSGVADDAADALSKVSGLLQLDLAGTKVTDKGLNALSQLPKLSRIVLSNTQVTDKGIAELRKRRPNCQIVR